MEKILNCFVTVGLFAFGVSVQAQIKTNTGTTPVIASENPFLDASSFIDYANNKGKGLVFPRTDLTQWTFILGSLDGFSVFPTAFDGMIVYNSGTGDTLLGQGTVTAVTPGFYYFYNPTGNTDITAGIWTKLGSGSGSVWSGGTGTPASISAILTQGSDYVALATDETILVNASSGAVTITLPTATSSLGKKFNIKKIDNTDNNVIVASAGGTIDTVTTITGGVWLQGWVLQSDGTNWFVISRY